MRIITFKPEIQAVIKDAGRHIAAVLFCFAAGAFIGFQHPDRFSRSFEYLVDLAGFLKNQNAMVIIIYLFSKNALASLIALWAGALLGLVPIFAAVQNGILTGAVLSRQESIFLSVLNIIPHGIFELPAFLIACGIGVWRGMWLFRTDKQESYQERARRGYLVFFRFIMPLLAIAAIIEGGRIAMAIPRPG
jgi:stage II sporulation protein M